MAEAKAGKTPSAGSGQEKSTVSKRRGASAQTQSKKPPSKSAMKQIARDWDQVT
jgi:hypothetical protein